MRGELHAQEQEPNRVQASKDEFEAREENGEDDVHEEQGLSYLAHPLRNGNSNDTSQPA